MTISLLRQIWQRIVDKQAPPRQRLTGFEPLEPRMVLSGFSAFFAPDYSSLPPGDFSHIDRSGAEYAMPTNVEFGRSADYNTPFVGVSMMIEPRFVGFVGQNPIATRDAGDWVNFPKLPELVAGMDSGSVDAFFTHSLQLSSTSSGDFAVAMTTSTLRFAASPTLIDHVGDSDGGSPMAASSFRLEQFVSLSSTSTQTIGSPLNYTEIRGFPGNIGSSPERREPRENIVEGAGGAPRAAALEAAFAHVVGIETTSRTNAASNTVVALISGQADGVRGASSTRSGDGSIVSGQDQGPANQAAASAQSEIDEAYAVSRRGLKRRLPGDATSLDETDGEDSELLLVSDDTDAVLLLEAARQFEASGNAGTQIPELALANFPADGLIDVIAADVESRTGDHKLLETGRLVMVEPAMMAYQAFEMVIDRNSQAETRVADAADVATFAMTEQPVVQVQ